MSKNTPFDEIDKRCSNQAFYKKIVGPKEQILTRWESKDLPNIHTSGLTSGLHAEFHWVKRALGTV